MKKYLLIVFFFFGFLFLFLNIVYSQLVSPIYSSLVAGEKQAAIQYLRRIKTLPQFQQELAVYKNIYNGEIEKDVFLDEQERKKSITRLELLLKQNPKARDVLYSLYLLYKDGGNEKMAVAYLQKAREVDPMIRN